MRTDDITGPGASTSNDVQFTAPPDDMTYWIGALNGDQEGPLLTDNDFD